MKKIFCSLSLFFIASINAKEYGVPEEYEMFMSGYEYQYTNPPCDVRWHDRSATFMFNEKPDTNECEKIPPKKLTEDAIKSIEYVKKKGDYENFLDYYYKLELAKTPYSREQSNQDAISIWVKGCNDYKKGKLTQDFSNTFKIGDIPYQYPRIKRNITIRLYGDGWKTASAYKGRLVCEETGYYLILGSLKELGDMRKNL